MSEEKKGNPNELICKYKINDLKQIRIFGETFVKNNNSNCKIIYNEKEQELIGIFDAKDLKTDTLEIKLIGLDKITDASYMFYNCISLISIENIENWNTKNINNMSNLFYNCRSLLSLPDISKWDTSNVIDMSYLFYNLNLYN